MKRSVVGVFALLAACSSTTNSLPTQPGAPLAPATTPRAATTTGPAPTTPAVTSTSSATTTTQGSAPTSTPGDDNDAIVNSLPNNPSCALGDVPERGQITFVVGQYLWGVDNTGAVNCLVDVGTDAASLQRVVWGPEGDRALLDGNRVVVDNAIIDSGFFADNTDVEFSAPTGKRTFAATRDGKLKKREVLTASATEITFLADHTASAYHPAGMQIATAGHLGSVDGPLSIQLATNEGADSREIVDASDADQITELRFDYEGTRLFFIGHHDDGWHLNRLDFPGLTLDKLGILDEPISRLTVSSVDPYSTAVQVGDCAGPSTPHVKVFNLKYRDLADDDTLGEMATTPVGWLPDSRLVVAAQDASCTGPIDLYLWDPKAPVRLIVRDVGPAAVRIQAALADPLPDDIESQAPA
jgi:hypothetical protein